MQMPIAVLAVAAAVLIFVVMTMYLASRYRRCPSDKILVVYGSVGRGESAQCVHGGGKLILPLIQDYAYLSLTPMTISIPLQNALSLQNIRINVPSTFTVGISTNPSIMNNAAERLLGLTQPSIEDMAREIIFGQLRLTVASLTIEQINQDRESFLDSIRRNVEPELNKVGLYLINVNITDITDESEYIESIGQKAASEAINRAKVDVAEQNKLGAIGESAAYRERDIQVAQNVAASEKGQKAADTDKRVYVQGQEASAIEGENRAKADIASYNATLAVREAESLQQGEVAKRQAQVAIEQAQYGAELERLRAAEVARQEVEKSKEEISAEAVAERLRREARGQADAILAKFTAEAEGTRKVLQAKADGYGMLVSQAGGDSKSAATLLMIEKIEEIVGQQVEAIKNLKIDKITVWDSGGAQGSSTSGFVSSLIKSLPPFHEIAEMAGVELPDYLGRVKDSKDSGVKSNGVSNDGEPPAPR